MKMVESDLCRDSSVQNAGLPCEAPQNKTQTAVGIQADGYLAGRVEFALQLYGATQCTDSCMRYLEQTHPKGAQQLVTVSTRHMISNKIHKTRCLM